MEQGRARSPENGHASSDGKKRPRDLRKQRRRGQGETNPGLFEAYGFTVAEDRLWQLELNRRVARGRLAEILGPGFVDADRVVRVTGYKDAELDAQFVRLTAEEREIFTAL